MGKCLAISGRLQIKSKNAEVVAEAVTALVSSCRAVPTAREGTFDYFGDFTGWSDFAIGEAGTDSGFALETVDYEERLLCAISTRGLLTYVGHGKEILASSGEVLICDSQCVKIARFSENYGQFFITTSISSVQSYARQHLGQHNRSFAGSYVVLPSSHPAAVSLAGFTPLINLLLADKEILKLSPIKMRRCKDAFLSIIASCINANGTFLGLRSDKLGSTKNLRDAEAFMSQHANEPIGVAEVAQAVGISVRSLQLVYRRYVGITPMARLQRIRLEGLHAELAGGLSISVRTSAAAWGFVSGARLNRQYLEAFGEKPAETLARANR